MAVRNRQEALARAMADKTNVPGTCQKWVRELYGAPSAGDRDRDNDADAVDGWKSEPVFAKHLDRNPPAGVPVAFSGGSRGYGHRCISRGGQNMRSTDMRNGRYAKGVVGNATITQIELAMGVKYEGWSETITGLVIPVPPVTKPPVKTTTFFVDLSHWQFENGFDLEILKPQGYPACILKVTEGVDYVDPTYRSARVRAKKLGLMVGVYHFLRRGNAAKQAENLARNIMDKGLPVFIDVEPTKVGNTISRPTAKDWIEFRNAATKLGLNVVGKYLTSSYWEEIGKPDLKGPLVLWRAAYPSSDFDYGSRLYPGNSHARWQSFGGQTPKFWQFASTGKLDGFPGGVDVNAYRGTLEQLKKTGLFKDYSLDSKPAPVKPKPTPAPAPKPTPAPAPAPTPAPKPVAKPKSKEFNVFLVPGQKSNSFAQVKAMAATVAKDADGFSGVMFNTERHTQNHRDAVSQGLGPNWTRVLENENTIAFGKNWKVTDKPSQLLLAKDDPGMPNVNPWRYLSGVPLENRYLKGITIKHKGLHLVSEANCIHKDVFGRAYREKTWPIQVADVIADLKKDYDNDIPQVVAGDWNTGVYFTGKQLTAKLKEVFGDDVVHVFNGNLDHIHLISSKSVKLEEVGVEKKKNTAADHDMIEAKIKATVR